MVEVIRPSTAQRIIGFGAGALVVSFVYFSTHRQVWRQTAEVAQQYGAPTPVEILKPTVDDEQPFFGPKLRATLTRKWNQSVDATLGALAGELAKRGL
ncbi:hypothetical protein HXX76_011517 [Chlamydomonas incerta]|uniref:Uncharacterized protein n=1 Tax=Chlamydomonas incerta TaxID=51695 RepID=A0A835VTL1_CHLIN|nr:hypothetical protein HXX76_011517 [Chlamydomonas incerta]|eukprot:KAG2428817.1 hypothetical protein HXX76_011517 [Chlamydomonas incerta]